MSIFPKTLIILSTLCYIATSSLAAAHAFPMMGKQNSQQTVLMQGDESVRSQANADQPEGHVEGHAAATAMSCHQATSSMADNAAGACKAFCSAIGQALLSVATVEAGPARHSQNPCFNADSLLTRHISVDHQPPK